jgi:hypothetical protein
MLADEASGRISAEEGFLLYVKSDTPKKSQ